ncbi:MAG: hypothetical protein WBF48_13040 [Halarcobacter sp.]
MNNQETKEMPIKFKKNKNLKPDVILQKINEIATINSEGKVSFEAFTSIEAESALYSMIDFGIHLHSSIKERLIRESIRESILKHKLTKDNFLKEINQQLIIYNKREEKTFYFLTSLSFKPFGFKKIMLNNCLIRFVDNFPNKYKERNLFNEKWNKKEEHTPSSYIKVIVKVKTKTDIDAVKIAIDTLDLLRALLCILLNSGYTLSFPKKPRRIINVVLLGGLHTIHYESGKLACKYYWHEIDYEVVKPFSVNESKKKNTIKSFKFLYTKLNESKFKNELIDGLLRYVRAFDEKDKNVTLIKGWNAIEGLVAKNKNNFELIPKRISFLFEEVEYNKQILEHLREYRNTSVHKGESITDVDIHCHKIQEYFKHLIIYYLNNTHFSTIEEANNFLDLPVKEEELLKKRDLINKALKFRGFDKK